ncbi:MAG: glycogen synthase GlgA [Planctomycetes bacterium]|nr:glycogen synthase GlgA [Planctomycetota bacterium]
MKCLHVASEVAGFAKTGGLADVVGSLPIALTSRGIDTIVVMPFYRACRSSKQPIEPTEHRFRVPIGERVVEGRLWRSKLPGSDVPVYLIEQDDYFDRDALYQITNAAGEKVDHADNSARFGFFSRAVLEAIRLLDFWPDILHLHDWQTGLAGVYLRELYQKHAKPDLRDRYASIRTFFTIHNLAYQGTFWHLDVPMLGLPWRLFNMDQLEFYGKLNFLKAGLVYADMLTTVSPTYAKEIQTTMYGCGLQGVLMQRSDRLHGIVNGIDDRIWNPALDPHVAAKYDADSLDKGKPLCKTALQKHFGLDVNPRTPLLGIISRLATQKGFDLIQKVVPAVLKDGVQLAVLGDGDKIYADMFLELKQRFPGQVGVHLGYSDPLAHQIEAGADLFLMPSNYEPCGLNQLYSLKYGTVPVVHTTGGLADTVVDATPPNIAAGRATGFTFVSYAAAAFSDALRRALAMYQNDSAKWKQLQRTGMAQDWSWSRSAAEYERLYRRALLQIS